MNKKYLSALLFGALTLASTGTFTSCKDYDDDIENLQGQIDKLTAEDLKSKITTLEAALGSAEKNAKDAIEKAEKAIAEAQKAGNAAAEAKAAAEVAEAKAKAAAVEEAKKVVADAETRLNDLVAKGLAENEKALQEMSKEVKKATDKVEAIVGKIADMVTHVDLVTMDQLSIMPMYPLIFTSTQEQDNVFGEGLDNAITFDSKNQYHTGSKIWVRVSPTNAVLTKEMISLVDSKGNNLDEVLDLEVKPFDGLLQGFDPESLIPDTKAANQNGLWEVSVKLKKYDAEAFEKLTNPKSPLLTTLYAVQVNNTLSTADSRYVTSAYDLQLHHFPYQAQSELFYNVNGKSVYTINNRFTNEDNECLSLTDKTATITYEELGWAPTTEEQPTPAVKGTNKNTLPDVETDEEHNVEGKPLTLFGHATPISLGDDRHDREVLAVKQGEAIKISLDHNILDLASSLTGADKELLQKIVRKVIKDEIFGEREEDGLYVPNEKTQDAIVDLALKLGGKTFNSGLRGMYVTLDVKANAVESNPSEWNAWTSYDIDGLNKVVDGRETTITINDAAAVGDYIGFRVYAVNQNGTLVDPDGKAFYVYVQGDKLEGTTDLTAQSNEVVKVPFKESTLFSSKAADFNTANWTEVVGGYLTIVTTDSKGEVVNDLNFMKYIQFQVVGADGKIQKELVPAKDIFGSYKVAANVTSIRTAKLEGFDAANAKFKDGETYTVTITVENPVNGVKAVQKINITKEMPGFPANRIYPATNVIVDHNLKIYPVYYEKNNNVYYNMKNVWNGVTETEKEKFVEINADPKKVIVEYDSKTSQFIIKADKANPYLNPAKEEYGHKFPMKVTYSYGKVSYALNAKTNAYEFGEWAPAWGEEFTIELGNYINDCTIAWTKDAPSINYPGAEDQISGIALADINMTDWYKKAVELNNLPEEYFNGPVEVVFVTGANKTEGEYYEFAGFGKKAGDAFVKCDAKNATHILMESQKVASQGTSVETTVKFVFKDFFGNTIEKTMDKPFTMNFQSK